MTYVLSANYSIHSIKSNCRLFRITEDTNCLVSSAYYSNLVTDLMVIEEKRTSKLSSHFMLFKACSIDTEETNEPADISGSCSIAFYASHDLFEEVHFTRLISPEAVKEFDCYVCIDCTKNYPIFDDFRSRHELSRGKDSIATRDLA